MTTPNSNQPNPAPSLSGQPSELPTDLTIETAFHRRIFKLLVAAVPSDVLPPRGVAGQVDWKTRGLVSRLIERGAVSSALGELTYVPLTPAVMPAADEPFHLILVGVGQSENGRPGIESARKALSAAAKAAPGLGVDSVGLSRADFGDLAEADIRKAFKGMELWISP